MRLRVRVLLAALVFCAAAVWLPAEAARPTVTPAVTAAATVAVTPSPEPVYPEALQISTSLEPDLLVAPEETHVTVTLTNTGDTPIGNLRLLRPSGLLVENIGTLEPGASHAFEESVNLTLDQFRAGGVTYLVRCALNPCTADEVEGRMTVTAPLQRIPAEPAVEFSRSASSEYVQAGEQVALTYRVANTGNVPLTELVVSDPLVGDVGTLDELAPGQKHTFTARVSVKRDAESMPSLTCFSKADPENPIVRDLGATQIHVTDQRLEATLSADFGAVRAGGTVTLKLDLYNASDIALEKLHVYDQTGQELDNPPFSLKPGERYELTQPVPMKETTTFMLTVSGRTEGGSAISARSNALTIAVQASLTRARISLVAQVNPNTPVTAGTVRFSIRLTNTGEDALRGVKLSELSRGPVRTLWVVPPGETAIEQDYPIGGKPFVFLAEMADDKGGRLTVLSSPVTVEAAAQPVSASPTPTPIPLLTGASYQLSTGPSTFLTMMISVLAVLAVLITIFAISGVRKRRKIEKQRRIHIKRLRRSMREPKPEVSQETRAMPVIKRAAPEAIPEEKRGQ
jgi:uncharacterized repeat protein (TIGR01451 family)